MNSNEALLLSFSLVLNAIFIIYHIGVYIANRRTKKQITEAEIIATKEVSGKILSLLEQSEGIHSITAHNTANGCIKIKIKGEKNIIYENIRTLFFPTS